MGHFKISFNYRVWFSYLLDCAGLDSGSIKPVPTYQDSFYGFVSEGMQQMWLAGGEGLVCLETK